MKPVKVEYGTRYGDGSGWEKKISADESTDTVIMEQASDEISFRLDELDWWVDALLSIQRWYRSSDND